MRLGRFMLVAALVGVDLSAHAQQATSQLTIASAVVDPAGQTLTISGANFALTAGRFSSRPFVTLDLVPLDIRAATDTTILAAAPSGSIPPATYLLSVSRGPAPSENATIQMTVGSPASPSAPASSSSRTSSAAAATQPASWAQGLPLLAAGNAPAATVGDHVISVDDVDREWKKTNPTGYLEALRDVYEARRQVLNTMVADELLAREAASRGITVDALLAEEIPKRVIPMPDSAVTSLYLSLGDNARGASLDQMRPALRAWLQKHSEPELAKMSYIEELKKVSTRADVLLDAPRIAVDRDSREMTLGPASAPVDMVVFGDFQSEEYAHFAEAFSRVREAFGDRLRLTFKNLPMLSPLSFQAAEAGLCVNAQGKFWPYHDSLVKPGPLDIDRITKAAVATGINPSAFNDCVGRHEFADTIRDALAEGERYGIHGSPSFLVNGRLAPPAPAFLAPYDYFKLLIEEELARIAMKR